MNVEQVICCQQRRERKSSRCHPEWHGSTDDQTWHFQFERNCGCNDARFWNNCQSAVDDESYIVRVFFWLKLFNDIHDQDPESLMVTQSASSCPVSINVNTRICRWWFCMTLQTWLILLQVEYLMFLLSENVPYVLSDAVLMEGQVWLMNHLHICMSEFSVSSCHQQHQMLVLVVSLDWCCQWSPNDLDWCCQWSAADVGRRCSPSSDNLSWFIPRVMLTSCDMT